MKQIAYSESEFDPDINVELLEDEHASIFIVKEDEEEIYRSHDFYTAMSKFEYIENSIISHDADLD